MKFLLQESKKLKPGKEEKEVKMAKEFVENDHPPMWKTLKSFPQEPWKKLMAFPTFSTNNYFFMDPIKFLEYKI